MNQTDPITLRSRQNESRVLRSLGDRRCAVDRALIVTCVLALAISSCAATGSSRGWVSRAEVGKPFANFVYLDDQGVQRSLRNHLADFTVVAFTRCDRETHGPASGLLREIVNENRRAPLVKVIGVDVHWFEGRCDHSQCHLVADERDILSICDATGAIRRLYGVEDADQVIVIGPDHNVVYSADFNRMDDLRERLRSHVVQLSDQRSQEISQEYQSIGY